MSEPDERLSALRRRIDNIDAALIFLLAERFGHTREVGGLKARYGMSASDPQREAGIVSRLRILAHEADLDPDFAEAWFAFVLEEVIRHHTAHQSDVGPQGAG